MVCGHCLSWYQLPLPRGICLHHLWSCTSSSCRWLLGHPKLLCQSEQAKFPPPVSKTTYSRSLTFLVALQWVQSSLSTTLLNWEAQHWVSLNSTKQQQTNNFPGCSGHALPQMAHYTLCLIPDEHALLVHPASPSPMVFMLGLLHVQLVPSCHWCRWIFCPRLRANCPQFQLAENLEVLVDSAVMLQADFPVLTISASPSNLVTPLFRNGGLTHCEGWQYRDINIGTQHRHLLVWIQHGCQGPHAFDQALGEGTLRSLSTPCYSTCVTTETQDLVRAARPSWRRRRREMTKGLMFHQGWVPYLWRLNRNNLLQSQPVH